MGACLAGFLCRLKDFFFMPVDVEDLAKCASAALAAELAAGALRRAAAARDPRLAPPDELV